jgi:hypothetical protein
MSFAQNARVITIPRNSLPEGPGSLDHVPAAGALTNIQQTSNTPVYRLIATEPLLYAQIFSK